MNRLFMVFCQLHSPFVFIKVQLMFPLTAMMNHSCQPSISRSITMNSSNDNVIKFKMRVVAARSEK